MNIPARESMATGLLLASLLVLGGCSQEPTPGPSEVPLYSDLGDYHFPISSEEPGVQAYFDQGIRLYYAFNHAEAIRSFKEAQRLDDDCAVCWWAEALAWGPNINLPMDEPSGLAAYAALEQAMTRKAEASELEQDLIEALALRYTADAPEQRANLDGVYSAAMAGLVSRYPDNLDVGVLYAESLMDLRPWDYWTADGEPRPGMDVALRHLEQAITSNPQHPGACHFYIHAVEAVYPQRAVPCAERLASLMPGAGHLVHMPGHIYIRVGRYLDAVEANEHAVHADETYIQDQHPGMGMYTAGYYPHNYDFMAFAAMMIGRSELAISSAEKVSSLLPLDMFGAPGMDFLQHWSVRPLLMQVRFARWDDILALPIPGVDRPHSQAIWHYARGRALLAQGDVEGAYEELDALRDLGNLPELEALKMEYNQSADLLAIAERVLTGWAELADGQEEGAVAAMRQAVNLESQLLYGEPPEWSIPPRQDLGALLLRVGRAADAEQVFRADLEHFPENGWSLYGLMQSLQAQGRQAEAQQVSADFERVWATADVAATSVM